MIQCRQCGLALTPAQRGAKCPRCGSKEELIIDADHANAIELSGAVRELAMRHYEIEDGLVQIFRIADRAAAEFGEGEPIKLLEVNANTPETGIMPLYFGPVPASGIPYASVIVEVSPNEYEKIKSNELELPDGWVIGEEIPRARLLERRNGDS